MLTIYSKIYIHLLSIVALVSFNMYPSLSQEKVPLTLEDYIIQVKSFHPILLKSSLIVDQSQTQQLAAKAQFDPQIFANQDRKDFDSKNYYNYHSVGIEMVTKSPIAIKSGYENNDGDLINPELTRGGMIYLGVEMPLLNGFMMDQRRASLAQAKLFVSQSNIMKQIAINDLLLDAHNAYWSWASAYLQMSILENFTAAAEARLQFVKTLYSNGDRAVADTIEAAVQLDYFKLQVNESKLNFINETFNLSSFLWNKNNIAYIIDDRYIPDTTSFRNNIFMADSPSENILIQQNPNLKIYGYKLSALQIDRKLKSQYLLPKLDIKAQMLRRNNDFPINNNLFDNYKVGIGLKYPFFTRAAKAQLQENKIKSSIVQFDLEQQKWEYSMKYRTLLNEYYTLQNQIQTMLNIIFKNTQLRDLENVKLSIGESTLFLINARENKIVESLNKHVDLLLKMHKTKAKIDWITGSWVSSIIEDFN